MSKVKTKEDNSIYIQTVGGQSTQVTGSILHYLI
jgi:hypothetical protein